MTGDKRETNQCHPQKFHKHVAFIFTTAVIYCGTKGSRAHQLPRACVYGPPREFVFTSAPMGIVSSRKTFFLSGFIS